LISSSAGSATWTNDKGPIGEVILPIPMFGLRTKFRMTGGDLRGGSIIYHDRGGMARKAHCQIKQARGLERSLFTGFAAIELSTNSPSRRVLGVNFEIPFLHLLSRK
jgi:hypothetical protein